MQTYSIFYEVCGDCGGMYVLELSANSVNDAKRKAQDKLPEDARIYDIFED